MFASVNSREYLQDPTGNRRFWTVEVESINARHGMDMQQVWAEVAEMWRNDPAGLFLRPEEMDALNLHNDDFMSLMPVHERIDDSFEWDYARSRWDNMLSATQITELAGIDRPSQREVNEAASYVQTRYNVDVRKVGKQRVKRWAMPPLTAMAEDRSNKR
jgi:putative DNA primase/helicase